MSKPNTDLVDQVEWQAQERGMDMVHVGVVDAIEAAASEYRVIAEAIMSVQLSAPPMDFAIHTARYTARDDTRLERALSWMLTCAFVVAVVVVGLCYGEQWWQSIRQAFGSRTLQWGLACLGCVAMSGVCRHLIDLASCFCNGRSVRPRA